MNFQAKKIKFNSKKAVKVNNIRDVASCPKKNGRPNKSKDCK